MQLISHRIFSADCRAVKKQSFTDHYAGKSILDGSKSIVVYYVNKAQ